ncbi:hypothetical protein BCIN_05g00950 [Botrytis cinerea B05.10]|uniref:Uncharacterized protein n=2 Tax=Botryotinia fuckeliana TaxID=40559 RepID=A0A384JGY7_BOTFB|nr:hypothetical protein BCIN_05g00950 [Botrytis cinerea B05.10]ATZ49677.1 hypothetical protein BCIN_05g00950 [Botrytis cinerea B05.10]
MQRLIHSRFHGMLLGSRVYVPQMSTIKCINGFGYYVHWIVVTLIRYTDAFGFMESFMTCNITLPLMPMVWSTPIDLEAHPLWSSNNPNPSIHFLWDFVKRGEYMLLEYDTILNGRPLQHADQFRQGPPGTGENAALKVFQEVCGRTMMLNMIVTDTTGRMAMMMGSSGPSVDYGDDVRQVVKALEAVVPQEHLMAGMVG